MRLWPAVVFLAWVAAFDAFACPTCVGPRLGDASSGDVSVQAGVRSALGSDRVGDVVDRLEWSNALEAGVAWSRFSAGVALPFVWRQIDGVAGTGFGDLSARGSVEVFRREEPADSDALRLIGGLGVPTSRGATSWLRVLGTQAFTPLLGFGWRHSDQDWAVSALAWGALPFAQGDAGVVFGPSAGTGVSGEYSPWRWLTGKLSLDFKQQWAAREAGVVLADSQFSMLLLSVEARVQPVRWLSVVAGLGVPLACESPGEYAHGRVYRLGLELSL